MSFFVPTRFVWRFGGRQVHLCGSFTRWVETIPMAPVDGTPGVFAVVVHLPPGYHQYKFIVDGKWMHDETAPYMPDPLGNVNNWLFVRKIDPPAAQNGLTLEQQQHLLQQLQEQQQAAAVAALAQQQQQQAVQAQSAVAQQAGQQQMLPTAALQQPQVQQQQQQQQLQQQQQQAPMLQQAGFGVRQGPQHPSAAAAAAAGGGGGGNGGGGAVAPGGLTAALTGHQGILQQGLMGTPAAMQQQQQHQAAQQLALSAAAAAAAAAAATNPVETDVDMAAADNTVVAPIIIQNEREPDLTKKKVSDFLHHHTAYELIPESGKVVLLDMDLPVRQAFHALHEQGIASAPLYDSQCGGVVGVISASDFIHMLRRLKHAVSSGNNPLSEAEMDAHTIRAMREECALEGRPPKPLVYVRTTDKLAVVVRTLFEHKCSMAPILSADPGDSPGSPLPSVLHIATLSGVLNCLMRHFRASLASLPLLALPLSQVPVGTWAPEQQFLPGSGFNPALGMLNPGPQQQQHQQQLAAAGGGVNGQQQVGKGGRRSSTGAGDDSDGGGGDGAIVGRTVSPLHAVTPTTALTTALGMLLEAGVSALPVVNEQGVLLDIYARSDITKLCKGNAYSRLQWEDVTVGQALSLSSPNPTAWQQATAAGSRGALMGAEFNAAVASNPHLADSQLRGGAPGGGYGAAAAAAGTMAGGRVAVAYQDDPLRVVVERLAGPGVRRLVVVDRATKRVQGLVSLSDVAAYLFL